MTPAAPNEADAHYAYCLDLWLRWMGRDSPVRGFSGLDSVCGRAASNFMAGEDDSDIVYEKQDRKIAEVVNACVESLIPEERLAIYCAHGLSRSWPWANRDMRDCYVLGTATLKRLVAKRC
jgi:hypothetical protein